MLGEELMVLNPAELGALANPRRRRAGRLGRGRVRARTRVRVRFPRARRSRDIYGRFLTRRSRPYRRRRARRGFLAGLFGRARRNPVARAPRFKLADIPKHLMAGTLGAAAGGGGYYLSKLLLPAEYDRHIFGYVAHGAIGTGLAVVGGMVLKVPVGVTIGGAWATVGFRILLNTLFAKAARPKPMIPPSEAAQVKGLAGIEEALPVGFDVGDPDDEHEVALLEQVSRRFIGGLGQEYQPARSLPAASMPVGQAYQRPEPYDVGNDKGVGQAYQSPEPYDVGQTHEEAPELGLYSKRPVTHYTPVW